MPVVYSRFSHWFPETRTGGQFSSGENDPYMVSRTRAFEWTRASEGERVLPPGTNSAFRARQGLRARPAECPTRLTHRSDTHARQNDRCRQRGLRFRATHDMRPKSDSARGTHAEGRFGTGNERAACPNMRGSPYGATDITFVQARASSCRPDPIASHIEGVDPNR